MMNGVARSGATMAVLVGALLLAGCGDDTPVDAGRYVEPDRLYARLLAGVDGSTDLTYVLDIDHSRLAGEQGVAMPPSHVLIASAPRLEAAMLQRSQLLGLELPLRALAYESTEGESWVTYNRWGYIAARHNLEAPGLAEQYDTSMGEFLREVPESAVRHFATDAVAEDGIVTFTSAHNFSDTLARAREAIEAQGDTVWFGEVDFGASASSLGVDIPPTRLLLFGGPEPGGRAMARAPTLGLDAFCQKLLIWQGEDGRTRISFNDLVALANRQGVPKSLALRVINFRVKSTYEAVASPD